MTALTQRFKERYFTEEHPYRTFEAEVARHLRAEHSLLDVGCGRSAPVLSKYKGRARRLIGVDLVDFQEIEGLELLRTDIASMPLPSSSVDLVMSRSVMEHVTDPRAVYGEIYRVLKPGGYCIVLTANLWDYASIIAMLVPNRFHPWIVSKTEGREEHDVFPVDYRTNTRRSIARWANTTGFELASFNYLGQYPSYFMFNGALFLAAAAR